MPPSISPGLLLGVRYASAGNSITAAVIRIIIADENGGIDWLHAVPNPDHEDHGYYDFMKGIDALLMGRVTFETVLGFGIDWPYDKPVFVLSRNLEEVPADLAGKVFIVNGELSAIFRPHSAIFHWKR